MLDESFVCAVCGEENPPLGYSARDHCRKCLCSLHLDIDPGDRLCDCKGVLRPVATEQGKKGTKITYRCDKCGKSKRNIAATDDDFDKLLDITRANAENLT
jgi:hypothetical protein